MKKQIKSELLHRFAPFEKSDPVSLSTFFKEMPKLSYNTNLKESKTIYKNHI